MQLYLTDNDPVACTPPINLYGVPSIERTYPALSVPEEATDADVRAAIAAVDPA
jgi:hypothetical protein